MKVKSYEMNNYKWHLKQPEKEPTRARFGRMKEIRNYKK